MKLLLLPLLMLFSFISAKEPLYIRLSNEIVGPYKKEVRKERGYECTGGGGSLCNNVKVITLTFTVRQVMHSQEEARRIIIELAEDLMARYNANEKIRPYLNDYPFGPRNTQILLLFNPKDPSSTTPLISTANLMKGSISYSLASPCCGTRVGELPLETYDEAYKLVYGKARQ